MVHDASNHEYELVRELYLAIEKLKDAAGWDYMTSAPTDGTSILCLEGGSSGIHEAKFMDGDWWILAHGDLWPSRPILWRAKKKKRTAE